LARLVNVTVATLGEAAAPMCSLRTAWLVEGAAVRFDEAQVEVGLEGVGLEGVAEPVEAFGFDVGTEGVDLGVVVDLNS
jgi:hypothetical protein